MLEAFSAGVPVLAFPSGGIAEAIQDNVTGFLVKDRSPRALASRLLELATRDQHLMSVVAANARLLWGAAVRSEDVSREDQWPPSSGQPAEYANLLLNVEARKPCWNFFT